MSIHLTKIVRATNQQRFYRMHIASGLFGEWGLVREWGRIGRAGRQRTDWFETEAEASKACADLHMQKTKRGYQ